MNQQPRYFFYDKLADIRRNYRDLDEETRARLKKDVAMNCPDPRTAADFADISDDDWANFYPQAEKPAPVTTSSAIETFLETYGHSSAEEDALLERLIFNPTPEYAGILEATEAENPTPHPDDLTGRRIDSFIAAHQPGAVQQPAPEAESALPPEAETATEAIAGAQPGHKEAASHPKPAGKPAKPAREAAPAAQHGASLSESLAKIYIKQGKYQRAFEIISDLNLKNPEKSVYFADQLRFLQKLILISARTSGPGQ